MINYVDNGDVAIFNGYSFRKDKKTGYFLSSKAIDGKRKRLHIAVWEFSNGVIQKGFHIHHKDKDKSNNEIENLELMEKSKHLSYHAKPTSDLEKKKRKEAFIQNALPKAIEWHKSSQGKEWHKKHAKEIWEKTQDKEYVCDNCKSIFSTKNSYSKTSNKFCSNKCKSAYRRKQGIDNVCKKCEKCGNEFIANKYSKTKRCIHCQNRKAK